MGLRKFLVCVDGSRASLVAARTGIDLACKVHGELRAIFVIERQEIGGATEAELVERLRDGARAMLSRLAEQAAASELPYDHGVLEGVPFEVILNEARRWNADVVVMGRTGRTGPGRALLGTEAERVLEFSDRPVLVVPTTEDGHPGTAARADTDIEVARARAAGAASP